MSDDLATPAIRKEFRQTVHGQRIWNLLDEATETQLRTDARATFRALLERSAGEALGGVIEVPPVDGSNPDGNADRVYVDPGDFLGIPSNTTIAGIGRAKINVPAAPFATSGNQPIWWRLFGLSNDPANYNNITSRTYRIHGNGGTGLQITATYSGGALASVDSIVSGGDQFMVGDVVTLPLGGTGTAATITINSVAEHRGAATGATITTAGSDSSPPSGTITQASSQRPQKEYDKIYDNSTNATNNLVENVLITGIDFYGNQANDYQAVAGPDYNTQQRCLALEWGQNIWVENCGFYNFRNMACGLESCLSGGVVRSRFFGIGHTKFTFQPANAIDLQGIYTTQDLETQRKVGTLIAEKNLIENVRDVGIMVTHANAQVIRNTSLAVWEMFVEGQAQSGFRIDDVQGDKNGNLKIPGDCLIEGNAVNGDCTDYKDPMTTGADRYAVDFGVYECANGSNLVMRNNTWQYSKSRGFDVTIFQQGKVTVDGDTFSHGVAGGDGSFATLKFVSVGEVYVLPNVVFRESGSKDIILDNVNYWNIEGDTENGASRYVEHWKNSGNLRGRLSGICRGTGNTALIRGAQYGETSIEIGDLDVGSRSTIVDYSNSDATSTHFLKITGPLRRDAAAGPGTYPIIAQPGSVMVIEPGAERSGIGGGFHSTSRSLNITDYIRTPDSGGLPCVLYCDFAEEIYYVSTDNDVANLAVESDPSNIFSSWDENRRNGKGYLCNSGGALTLDTPAICSTTSRSGLTVLMEVKGWGGDGIFRADDGTADNRYNVAASASGRTMTAQATVGGNASYTQALQIDASPAVGLFTFAASFGNNFVRMSQGGKNSEAYGTAAGTIGLPGAMTGVTIGQAGSDYLNGRIRRLMIIPGGMAAQGLNFAASKGFRPSTKIVESLSGGIETVANKDYTLILKAPYDGVIKRATTKAGSGTCTAAFKINTTALGGTANSVSTSKQTQAHTSANAFSKGDDIVLTVSSNSSCTDMAFSLEMERT